LSADDPREPEPPAAEPPAPQETGAPAPAPVYQWALIYPPPLPYARPPRPQTNGFAVAALVVGIVGLCFCFGLLGAVFGNIAKQQIRETGEAGDGLATAGIVLGWISVAFTLFWIVTRL